MQKQTYSCGNTPQPGDVVEVVTMEDLPEFEKSNWAKEDQLTFGSKYTVETFDIEDDSYLTIQLKEKMYWQLAPRFRLLRRAGEQPQPDILQAAIKLRLHLEAEKDIPKTNWKKGDRLELENNVFDKNTGIAFIPLDLGWKVNGVEILESDPQPDYAKLLEEKDEAIRELVEDLEQLNYWVNSENTKKLITKYKPQP